MLNTYTCVVCGEHITINSDGHILDDYLHLANVYYWNFQANSAGLMCEKCSIEMGCKDVRKEIEDALKV